MRLVLASFAILGLVFYEMSGGSDFRPPERPVAATKPEAEPTTADKPALQATAKPATTESVTRTLTIRPATLVATEANRTEAPQPGPQEENPQLGQVRASLTEGLTLLPESFETPPPSLIAVELGADGLDASDTPDGQQPEQTNTGFAAEPSDIREVIGTRVNMRDGPGTIYPVIARLGIGNQVEVLDDSGTGWLRLRTLPDKRLGWVSSSLVSKSSN